MKPLDCKICGYPESENICKECQIKLGDDKFALKCLNCGSYGFLKRNQTNINRIKMFLTNEEIMNLDNYWVVIIPVRGCPSCLEEFNK